MSTLIGYSRLQLVIFSLLGVFSALSHFVILIKTVQSLRVQAVLRSLVVLDIIVGLVASVVLFILVLVSPNGQYELCISMWLSIYIPGLVGMVSNAAITIIRYKVARLSVFNKSINQNGAIAACGLAFVIFASYVVVVVAIDSISGAEMLMFARICYMGEAIRPHSFVNSIGPLLIVGPYLIPTGVIVIFSWKLEKFVHNSIQPLAESGMTSKALNVRLTIPTQATRMSLFYFVGVLIVSAVVFLPIRVTDALAIAAMVGVGLNTIRIPLAMAMTFKHSKKEEQRMQSENSREQRRQREIAFALKARHERLAEKTVD